MSFAKNPRTSPAVTRITRAAAQESLMIDEILKVLQKCPLAQYEQGKDSVRVLPGSPEGFEVIIEQIWENHYSVTYGGWHEDFYSLEEALSCFFLGLSNHASTSSRRSPCGKPSST